MAEAAHAGHAGAARRSSSSAARSASSSARRAVGPWVQRGGSGVFALTTDQGGGTLGGDTSPNSKPSIVTFEPSDGCVTAMKTVANREIRVWHFVIKNGY
jgi:hypothetical protein